MIARGTKISRQQSAPDDTRTKLLAAGVRAFSEHGYEGATIRDICQKAGVNVALVNYHFGDKMELYLEAIRHAVDATAKMELLNNALEQNTDPSDALRQVIHGVIERLSETRDQFGLHLRFLIREMAQPTPAFSHILEETVRPLYDRLRSLIGRILNVPMDDVTTRLCTHSIMSQVSHYAIARPLFNQLWPELKMTPEQRRMVADHITDFSLAYLRAHRLKAAVQIMPKAPRKQK